MMSRAVDEYGGTVQAYQGDGICAYFGVPTAHEDDPERAARTALRILEVVSGYARDIEAAWGISGFAVRVGVNSGPAAVGLVGSADPQAVALGDATNVAARLQAAAEPGTILVGHVTARRLEHRFDLGAARRGHREGARGAGARPRGSFARRSASLAPRRRRSSGASASSRCCSGVARRSRRGARPGRPAHRRARNRQDPPPHRARDAGASDVTWLEGGCHSYGGLPRLAVRRDPPRLARRRDRRARDRHSNEGARRARGAVRRRGRRRSPPARPGCCASVSIRRRRRRTRLTRAFVRWLERLAASEAGHRRDRGHAVGRRADAPAGGAGARAHRPRARRARPDRGADSGLGGRARSDRMRSPTSAHRTSELALGPLAGRRGRAGARRHRRRRDRRGDSHGTHPRGGGKSALPRGARARASSRARSSRAGARGR